MILLYETESGIRAAGAWQNYELYKGEGSMKLATLAAIEEEITLRRWHLTDRMTDVREWLDGE